MKPMNHGGVTLIELVVVMVIITIAAAFMVPNIGAWLPNYRLRSATREIASLMRSAQMKAVSANLEYRAYFNAGERRYWIERGNLSSGSTNWVGTTAPGNLAREGAANTLPSGVALGCSGFVEFNPDSTCSSPGTITLRNAKGKQSSITLIPATGKVNLNP